MPPLKPVTTRAGMPAARARTTSEPAKSSQWPVSWEATQRTSGSPGPAGIRGASEYGWVWRSQVIAFWAKSRVAVVGVIPIAWSRRRRTAWSAAGTSSPSSGGIPARPRPRFLPAKIGSWRELDSGAMFSTR